jgi:histidinol-phosphatase (PHP family)
VLPSDTHVHTEWSWDALAGSMERSCERAVRLGLRAIAFTEHADLTEWAIGRDVAAGLPEPLRARVGPDGVLRPPPLDVEGYVACVDRCRDRFPDLRILSGVELGDPHWFPDAVRTLVAAGFDRVLGSLHSVTVEGRARPVDRMLPQWPIERIVREYLAEELRLVEADGAFEVLAHVDYPVRGWPAAAGPHDPRAFEDEYRAVLRALAGGGRGLEINTRVPLHPLVLRWWREAGGEAVSFGSDAHDPAMVAHDFAAAAAMAEAQGFHPSRDPGGMWTRPTRT